MKRVLSKGLVLMALLFATSAANAAIRISPGSVELDANKTKKDYVTGSFVVAGAKDETIRFKAYPEFFEYDSKGRYVELPDKGQPRSLIGKLNFYPMEFTCKGGLEQKVRFTVKDIKNLPEGESRLVLFLEDVDTKEVLLGKAENGIGGKIIVKTRVGVPIYLNKGKYVKKGTLDSLVLKQVGDEFKCEYKVSSLGNSRVRYSGYAYVSQGDKLIKKCEVSGSSIEGGKFLETAQKLDIPKDKLTAGQEYKVKFVLTYKDEKQNSKVLKKEITFIPKNEGVNKV